MLKAISYQIADSVDIKAFKPVFKAEIYFADSGELFYRIVDEKLIYVFRYGIVCFLNHSEEEIADFITLIAPYCKNLMKERLNEEFDIDINAAENRLGYNKIEIMGAHIEALRLIMLNVSQSVALDLYDQQAILLLEETNHHTQILEQKGKLDLSGIHLKKYIGRTLNLKNRIAQNLYIFDSPEETWDDENLNKLDIGLKKTFDLQARFRTIEEGLQIVKENLELFKDLLQYRNSITLEWIVIALILAEVVNLLFEKLS